MPCLSQTSPSSWPRLHVQHEKTWVQLPDGYKVELLPESIARSPFLGSICAIDQAPWQGALEIDAQALQEWLHHVQKDVSTPSETTTCEGDHKPSSSGSLFPQAGQECLERHTLPVQDVSSNNRDSCQHRQPLGQEEFERQPAPPRKRRRPAQDPFDPCNSRAVGETAKQGLLGLCKLFKAADMLMDEVTGEEACAALVELLELDCDWSFLPGVGRVPAAGLCVARQVLGELTEDLALRVLRAVDRPFSALLSYLSDTPFRPLLLRAVLPAIDASTILDLQPLRVSAQALPILLQPIAALTHLRRLSFRGHPLVYLDDAPGCGSGTALEHTLCALPRLTFLSLRATTLKACARGLITALPALPHLRTLDAGANDLDGAFAALAAVLPAAPSLRVLLLDSTGTTTAALRSLACALARMPLLEKVCIGSPGCEVLAAACDSGIGGVRDSAPGPLFDLITALHSMHNLHTLVFGYKLSGRDHIHLMGALASLTQLKHLCLQSVDLCNASPDHDLAIDRDAVASAQPEQPSSADADAAGLHTALGRLRGLTSLDLTEHCTASCERMYACCVLPGLARLTDLQQLQLVVSLLDAAACADVLTVVQTLPQLTKVALCSRSKTPLLKAAVRKLTLDLATMDKLRHIRVPVEMTGHWPQMRAAAVDAAKTLVQAAADKEVEIALEVTPVDPAAVPDPVTVEGRALAEVFSSMLPLCCFLRSLTGPPLLTDAFLHCAQSLQLTALTSLRIGVSSQHLKGAPQWVQQVGLLSGLQSLHFAYSRWPRDAGVFSELCGQAARLSALTELEVVLRNPSQRCLEPVLWSCNRLSGLQRLSIDDRDSRVGRQAVGNTRLILQRLSVEQPGAWATGKLTALQTLLLLSRRGVDVGQGFWAGVTQLSRLRSLCVEAAVDGFARRMLAEFEPSPLRPVPVIESLQISGYSRST